MPTVPLLQPGQQVEAAPLAGERVPRRLGVSPEAFGGGAASRQMDLSGLRDLAVEAYHEQKRKSDQIAVLGAAGQASELETGLAVHVRSLSGMNAFHAMDDVQQAWTDGVAKIHQTLTNDDQRSAFANVVQSHWGSLNHVVQSHVAEQHSVVDEEATKGYLKSEENAVLLNAADSSSASQLRVADAIQNSAAAIRAHGQRNGLPTDAIEAEVATRTSMLHDAVVRRLLAGARDGEQPALAQSYYQAHKDEIVGSAAIQLADWIGKKSVEGTAQQQADAIKKQSLTLDDAMQHAALITDSAVRDRTEQRLRRSFEDDATSAREQREQRLVNLNTMLNRNHGDYDALPIELRDQLTPTESGQLQRAADQIRNPKRSTNPEIRSRLLNEAGLHPDAFIQRDLSQYREQFDEQEFNWIQRKQLDMRLSAESKGKAADAKAETAKAKADAAAKKAAAARETLKAMGVDLGPAVPGAPITKPAPASAFPGQHPTQPLDPEIAKLRIPQSWKDHAAKDTAYANYLKHQYVPPAKKDEEEE